MIFCGIDNSLSGALAVISGSLIIDKCVMPVKAAKKGREVDVVRVWDWIYHTVQPQNFDQLVITIEEPGGAKSYRAAVAMAASFHALRAMCELKDITWHRITPQKWQKELLKAKAGDTKPAALRLATSIWPKESWLTTKRCTVPNANLVDAALIAEFQRRQTTEL